MTKERNKKALGVYVHVPFCLKKCNYCDFFSRMPKDAGEIEAYFNNLEIQGNDDYYVDTIFFGGGTPSMVEPRFIEAVLNKIKAAFFVMPDAEISLEANPETVTVEKLAAYKAMGINRISMGVQSLDDKVLKTMGRVHTAEKAREAFHLIQDAGFNMNCDVIFGAPYQNFESFQSTLDELIGLRPNHISFYSLQIEEATPFYADYRFGMLPVPSWEVNRQMYHYAVAALKAAGYHHYEVSNAALPGFECKHNLKYWTMQEYLGIGKAAHSFMGGHRTDDTVPNLKTDFVFTELRLVDGFSKKDYFERFGTEFEEDFTKAYIPLVNGGFLRDTGDQIAFTELGLDETNVVIQELMNSLEEV